MKLYKVMTKDLTSPFQCMQYGVGNKYVCENFDTSDEECSTGFYAVDFNGLVYALNKNGKKHDVWEVEVGGRSKEFNQLKRRYEEITLIRKLTEDEIKEGLKACEASEGYDTLEACYPVNPFSFEPTLSIEEAVKLLEEWKKIKAPVMYSVRDSIRYSVSDSVSDSVRYSVWVTVSDSVWAKGRASVGASVWAAVWAYMSSLFPNIKKWEGIEHEEGINPFQSGIDLWKAGYVPSFDGNVWRLHTIDGIVWEGRIRQNKICGH